MREGRDLFQAIFAEGHAVLHGAVDGLRGGSRGSIFVAAGGGAGRGVGTRVDLRRRLAALGRGRGGGIAIFFIVRGIRVGVVDGSVGQPDLIREPPRGLEEQEGVAGLHALDRVGGALGAQDSLIVRATLEHELAPGLDHGE